MITLEHIVLGAVGVGVGGAVLSYLGLRDPYGEVGHGAFALDVPDDVPPPPLDSDGGRDEVRQLLEAIETVRAARGRDA